MLELRVFMEGSDPAQRFAFFGEYGGVGVTSKAKTQALTGVPKSKSEGAGVPISHARLTSQRCELVDFDTFFLSLSFKFGSRRQLTV